MEETKIPSNKNAMIGREAIWRHRGFTRFMGTVGLLGALIAAPSYYDDIPFDQFPVVSSVVNHLEEVKHTKKMEELLVE